MRFLLHGINWKDWGIRAVIIKVTSNEVGPGAMEKAVKSPKVYSTQSSEEYESTLNSIITIRNNDNKKRSSNIYDTNIRDNEENHGEDNRVEDQS